MTALKGIFESICDEVECEVKPKLGGFITGAILRGNLPQHWVFKTEKETVTFSVDSNGNATVKTGAKNKPDVTITVDHDYLTTALTTRSQPSFSPKKFKTKFHTTKGERAFTFLRGRFGL